MADPAASALATYLTALGITATAASLSEWLALETGSALAVVLVNGTRYGTARQSVGTEARMETPEEVPATVPSVSAERPQTDAKAASAASCGGSFTGLKAAVLEHLEAHGGLIRSGQRRLAEALGASTSELHRTIHSLAAAGVIALSTAPTGTELRLAT